MAQAHGCIRGGKLQCQEETRDPGEASPQDPTRATGGSSFGGGSVIGDRLSSPSQADILLEHTVMDVRLSAVDASDAFCFGCAIETSLWMWRPPQLLMRPSPLAGIGCRDGTVMVTALSVLWAHCWNSPRFLGRSRCADQGCPRPLLVPAGSSRRVRRMLRRGREASSSKRLVSCSRGLCWTRYSST